MLPHDPTQADALSEPLTGRYEWDKLKEIQPCCQLRHPIRHYEGRNEGKDNRKYVIAGQIQERALDTNLKALGIRNGDNRINLRGGKHQRHRIKTETTPKAPTTCRGIWQQHTSSTWRHWHRGVQYRDNSEGVLYTLYDNRGREPIGQDPYATLTTATSLLKKHFWYLFTPSIQADPEHFWEAYSRLIRLDL